ncbi:DNA gyrase subunit B, partial [Patescibacteria group bacterium]|nr:DNA gyrase subunit B [Patescibacteria group bacterium]
MATKKSTKNSEYGAKDIQVLEGLAPVRKRPGMYIGSTGPDGLHHLVKEVLDNGIDEAMAGYAKNIVLRLLPGNRVQVQDDGRGIPIEKHPQTKKSTLETVMTVLHAGGKFGGKAYQVSGGLHGVGVSVVNALSSYLKVEVHRDGFSYAQEYSRGKPKGPVKKTGKARNTGTMVLFEPDGEIFKDIRFDAKRIQDHMRQQAYLTAGIRMTFVDEREGKGTPYSFYFEGGLAAYVTYLLRGNAAKHDNVFYAKGDQDGIKIEIAFQYTEEYETFEEGFANNILTPEGGTHITGFRTALTRTLNDYAKKNNFLKGEEALTGDDVREGLTAAVSVKLQDPQFEGQTKEKLGNPEVRPAVEAAAAEGLNDFLERNPQDARAIIEKCLLASKARKAAKAARQTVLRKGILEGLALPGKLADCNSKDPAESEIYIVEGESAGGSSKMARNRLFQAILPLRGKILNVERARLDKILASKEIKALVIALGAAIAEDFNIEKLRYHKIVIMTDADSVTGDTPMFVYDRKRKELRLVRIGEFVEKECDDTNRYSIFAYNSRRKKFSLRPIAKTIRHPLRTPLYEIRTHKGYTLEVTGHHSVFVVRKGELQTLPTKEIRAGDFVVLPKRLPRMDKERVSIDITETLKDSAFAPSIAAKLPAQEFHRTIPPNAWCSISPEVWTTLKARRMEQGFSRFRMAEAIGVGKTVIQQWEEKTDNVMPRFSSFADYLGRLRIPSNEPPLNALFVPLPALSAIPADVELYLHNHTRRVQREFVLDEHLAYLLGWFMGDGCWSFQKRSPNRIILCLGKDKKAYAGVLQETLEKCLGVPAGFDEKADGSLQ